MSDEFDMQAERLLPWDHRVDDDMHKAVASALRESGKREVDLLALYADLKEKADELSRDLTKMTIERNDLRAEIAALRAQLAERHTEHCWKRQRYGAARRQITK